MPAPSLRGAGMTELRVEADIRATPEAIFAAIVDLRGYHRWLTRSTAYAGTTEISAEPVTVGTTYVESSPLGVRRGTVTELDPPASVTFHQPMIMRPALLGVLDIRVRYTLTPSAGSVHLTRVVTLTLPPLLRLVTPVVVSQIRQESERTVRALRTFAESGS